MANIEPLACVAIGPRLDLDGPRPVAPPHSLLNTPGVVVERDGGRFLNGVNQIAYPADVPSLWEPATEGTYRVKSEGLGNTLSTFDAFVAYLPVACSSLGLYQDLQGQAEAVLDATLSMAVEQALVAGISGSVNPYVADSNLVVIDNTGTYSPSVGLRYLENAIAGTGRGGMILSSPAVVSALNADALRGGDQGELVTVNGTRVVPCDGAVNIAPDGESDPGGGMDWMFAIGPAEVRLGPMVMTSVAESLDRSDNTLMFRAERPVLVTWDTVLQTGLLVDWKLCCGVETLPV